MKKEIYTLRLTKKIGKTCKFILYGRSLLLDKKHE